MIDFSQYGSVVVHPNASELGLTIQFRPEGTPSERTSNQLSMLQLLDEYLNERSIERSILIQSSKNYPVPCVILHGVFNE